ncbi:hypothetical protein C1H46_035054 [Malus baccata]|uniref:Uncharacterized protein n=1 Tax=Malus baccata TaxID=106549 RepID=A0A540KYU5_MALBA|nr:hypothetical protein C1H46_035054 [Malus baccata]
MVVGDVGMAEAASSPSGMPEYKDQYDHYSRRFSELYDIINKNSNKEDANYIHDLKDEFVDDFAKAFAAALDELGSSADEAGKALFPEYGKKKMVVNGFL